MHLNWASTFQNIGVNLFNCTTNPFPAAAMLEFLSVCGLRTARDSAPSTRSAFPASYPPRLSKLGFTSQQLVSLSQVTQDMVHRSEGEGAACITFAAVRQILIISRVVASAGLIYMYRSRTDIASMSAMMLLDKK